MKTRIKKIELQNGDVTYTCEEHIRSVIEIIVLFVLIITIPESIKKLVKGYWEVILYDKVIVVFDNVRKLSTKSTQTKAVFKSYSEAHDFLVQYHEEERQFLSEEEGKKIKSIKIV